MSNVITGDKEYFKGIGQIKFEGPDSDNPLAFRYYDEKRVVGGKPMKEILRFACAYWHSFVGNGGDPFGEPTHIYPWNEKSDPVARAKDKMDAAFEFLTKINLPFYCFHDVDVVDYGNDVAENEKRLEALVQYAKGKQKASGIKTAVGYSQPVLEQKVYERCGNQSGFSCIGACGCAGEKRHWTPPSHWVARTMCSGAEEKVI
jgi:xylose isomerase